MRTSILRKALSFQENIYIFKNNKGTVNSVIYYSDGKVE